MKHTQQGETMTEQYDFEAIALATLGENKEWRPVFYPKTAYLAAVEEGATVETLIQHSFMKWLGLMPAVLRRLNHVLNEVDLYDNYQKHILAINATSCSLCQAYFRKHNPSKNKDKCSICPIYLSRGEVQCDEQVLGEDVSPWEAFQSDGNPIPMLNALVKASEFAGNYPELYQGVQNQRPYEYV
jgi:hypothetical protein